jgi:predicted GIY-YIG superfamily endonuclease
MRNGIVYKISCNFTGEIYIGSTFQSIRNRIAGGINREKTTI